MSYLSEVWLQELITKNLGLPAVGTEVVDEVLPFIELHVRKVIQQALKYQKRSKSAYLKGILIFLHLLYLIINDFFVVLVEDLNLVLAANRIEPLYGLHPAEPSVTSSSEGQMITKNIQNNTYKPAVISIGKNISHVLHIGQYSNFHTTPQSFI